MGLDQAGRPSGLIDIEHVERMMHVTSATMELA
jgi:hypothetical protein